MKKISLILALALIIHSLAFAQGTPRHASGDVDMGIAGFGSLAGGVSGNFLLPNFKYPAHAEGGNFYLNPFSEIWVGDAKGNVASALDGTADGIVLGEWETTEDGDPFYATDSSIRQEIVAQYATMEEARLPFDIVVDQHTFSWNGVAHPEAKDFVVMKLTLTNRLTIEVEGLYVAVAANWNIDAPNPGETNLDFADWDAGRQASIVYDADPKDGLTPVYAAVALLDRECNAHQILPVNAWQYLDQNRSVLISTPEKDTLQTIGELPGNYLTVLSSGPYKIRPRKSRGITFAFVAGKDRNSLLANIDAARSLAILPDMLKAEPKDKAVRISWRPAISESVMSYQIFRSETSDSGYVQIGPKLVSGSVYDDTDVKNGVKYYYVLRSVDFDGKVFPFNTKVVSAIPDEEPDAPKELQAGVVGTQVHLKWSPVIGYNLKNYNIYRNFTGEEPWTLIKTVGISETGFIDEDTYPGNVYYYTVTAVKEWGMQSRFSLIDSAQITAAGEIPKNDLNSIIVAPNPCKPPTDSVRFINLAPKSTIYIYSSAGELVRKLEHDDNTGVESWDLNNDEGKPVAGGVYLYYVEAFKSQGREELKASGKVAVIK